MEYVTPTTVEELHKTLQEIFYHYRIKRIEYEGLVLQPLNLQKLSFTPLTQEQFVQKATALVVAQNKKELMDKNYQLDCKILALTKEREKTQTDAQIASFEIEQKYAQSMQKINAQAYKQGVSSSSVVLKQLAELEEKKNEELLRLEQKTAQTLSSIDSSIAGYQDIKHGLSQSYDNLFEEQVQKKVIELKDEQTKKQEDIEKYNIGLEEKEQKYANTILRANAELQIKFLSMNAQGLSKDQLVDMGYYKDVINCVCDYYDGVGTALENYDAYCSDRVIPIYLDNYYSELLYMYRLRANA